jgi:TldD protein
MIAALILSILAAPSDDRLLTALEDELSRSVVRLRLEGAGPPYYLSYRADESTSYDVSASFGALSHERSGRYRFLAVDARVGDHSLDSSNFSSDSGGYYDFGAPMPLDDDYPAIRHALWLATDRAYKHAVEQREKKLAYLQTREVKDRPDDFSKESPVVMLHPTRALEIDRTFWNQETRRLSAIFRDYPGVISSSVHFHAEAANRWFVNNEGTRVRTGSDRIRLTAVASSQANDGAKVRDDEVLVIGDSKTRPSSEELDRSVRALAERVTMLARAPIAEKYRGPVLFEGNAAAEFFQQGLAPHLAAPREQLGPRALKSSAYPMRDELGRRVLPRFITVVDDPKVREYERVPLLGSFEIDDDGVVPQRLTIIDRGVLKTFCMSRAPTRELKKSNGHSYRGWGMAGNLFISSERQLPLADLRRALIDLGQKEELDHVYIVRKLGPAHGSGGDRRRASDVNLGPPILLYRVSVRDGSETLVRGAAFGGHSLRILRDIEATGDDVRLHPVSWGGEIRSIVSPSLLIEEVEIQAATHEREKLPFLPHPYFEAKLGSPKR